MTLEDVLPDTRDDYANVWDVSCFLTPHACLSSLQGSSRGVGEPAVVAAGAEPVHRDFSHGDPLPAPQPTPHRALSPALTAREVLGVLRSLDPSSRAEHRCQTWGQAFVARVSVLTLQGHTASHEPLCQDPLRWL